VVGVFGKKASVDLAKVNENELRLIGTARYVIEDFETAKDLLARKLVKLAPLVSDVVDFADYDKAYKLIQDKPDSTMKVIVRNNRVHSSQFSISRPGMFRKCLVLPVMSMRPEARATAAI